MDIYGLPRIHIAMILLLIHTRPVSPVGFRP